jgi:hypothetical protein
MRAIIKLLLFYKKDTVEIPEEPPVGAQEFNKVNEEFDDIQEEFDKVV